MAFFRRVMVIGKMRLFLYFVFVKDGEGISVMGDRFFEVFRLLLWV